MSIIGAITGIFMAIASFFFPNYGSTVTTINGSDTLSNSRTTINTNFSNLNTDKLEISTFYATTSKPNLAVVGTITSGTWNGTAVTVPYGGTGSTTLSSNQVLLGNGTDIVKTVSGFGNVGQVLASNGAATAPSWQSISFDTTATYALTGSWTHNATTTIAASSTTANALVLNGLAYKFPSVRGASSTVLMENGSGSLTWGTPVFTVLSSGGNLALSTSNTSTTTVKTVAISANTLTSTTRLQVTATYEVIGSSGLCYPQMDFGNGTATSTVVYQVAGAPYSLVLIKSDIFSTSTAAVFGWGNAQQGPTTPATVSTNDMFINNFRIAANTAATTYIDFRGRSTAGTVSCTLQSYEVDLIKY